MISEISNQIRRIVFLEATVEEPQHLIAGIRPGTQVVRLDVRRDGIEQISAALEGRSHLDSIHIVSHGESGRIPLGSAQLSERTLARYTHQFHRWRQALAADAEVLLYGCRIAAGIAGERFIGQLSQLLETKIAASTTSIGNAALGGNWDLDARTAPGEFALAFDSQTLAGYGGILQGTNPLYASEGADSLNLRVVNVNDGTSELVGQTAFRTFAIARRDPTPADAGLVYYIGTEDNGTARVGSWDPGLGEAGTQNGTQILEGSVGVPGQFVKLGQARDNRLFAMTGDDNILYTIDIEEGNNPQRADVFATVTGGSKPFPTGGGSGDIVFDPINPERLFISVTNNSNDSLEFYDLYTFNINTSQTTFIGEVRSPDGSPLDARGSGALGFGEDGQLYTTSINSQVQRQLFRVRVDDAANGIVPTELVGETGVPLSDLGSLPSATPDIDLVVDKQGGPEAVEVGDEVVYTITLENNSVAPPDRNPLNLTGLEIEDPIPQGLDVDIADVSFQITEGTGTITQQSITDGTYNALVNLNEQSTIVVTIRGTVTADAGQILSNTVTVKPPDGLNLADPEPDPINNPDDNDPDRIDDTVTILLNNLPPETQDATDNVAPGETKQLAGLIGNDTDRGTVVSYTISTLPPANQGTLLLDGNPVTAGQVLTPDELTQLEFEASNGFTGATFTYAATDDRGAIDRTPATVTLNPPPETEDDTTEVAPGTDTPLPALMADDPNGTVAVYQITELPQQGTLLLNGVPVGPNQTLTPAQVDDLVFRADPGFTGTTFQFTAIDNNGAADPTPATITLTPGNAPPETEDALNRVEPGDSVPITGLEGNDPDGTIGGFIIDTLPPAEQGRLLLDGTPVQAGQQLTPDQIDQLTFEATDGFTNATFNYSSVDNNGEPDPTPATVFLAPPGDNVPPDTDGSQTAVTPGIPTNVPNLGGSDPDDPIDFFTIATLPEGGTLFLGNPNEGGTAVSVNQNIEPDRITDLFFVGDADFTNTTFTYSATDEAGAVDPTPATVTLTADSVGPPDTDPAITSVEEDPVQVVGLGATPEDEVAFFTILTLPPTNRGQLFLGNPNAGGTPIEIGQVLTPDQIDNVFFAPNGPFTGTTTFEYSSTNIDGVTDPTPATVTISGSNLPPDTDDTLDTLSPSTTIQITGLGGEDPDGTVSFFTIASLPPADQGTLFLGEPGAGGIPAVVGLQLSPDDLDRLFFQSTDGFSGATFTYTATDNFGATDPSPATVTLAPPGAGGDPDTDPGTDPDPDTDTDPGPGPGTPPVIDPEDNCPLPPPTIDGFVVPTPDPLAGAVVVPPAPMGLPELPETQIDNGTEGDDIKIGNGLNEDLRGFAGNDNLQGREGDDIIRGGNFSNEPTDPNLDRDTLAGNRGRDVIAGSGGEDLIFGGQEEDVIFGGKNNDEIRGDRGADELSGDEGDDTIAGDNLQLDDPELSGTDRIDGGVGNDYLNGNEEDDTLTGGDGDDFVQGGKDGDEAFGDRGNDIVGGDLGNDTILGSLGSVAPVGDGEERDSLFGNRGADLLKGGEGPDLIRAGKDDDLGYGGKDNDDVLGDLGSDTLTGDLGDDTVIGGNGDPNDSDAEGQDMLYGGEGNDVLFGNQNDDMLVGEDGDDVAHGGRDNDRIFGDQGNDSLFGEFGNDTILGSRGSVSESEGDRDFISGNAGEDVIKGGEGEDYIVAGKGFDLVYGGKNDDMIFGDQNGDVLVGDLGNDTLIGGNGIITDPDVTGNDLLFGLEGNDVMEGNQGNDSIVGGNGDDAGRGGQDDDILWGEAGNDRLLGDLGNDTVCGGQGNDTLIGSNGITGSADDGNDKLCAGGGDDIAFGNSGDDEICGGSGNDALYGGRGNDTVKGGSGNDVLFGDLGSDLLMGGAGIDVFVLAPGSGIDTITDFEVGVDTIALSGGLTFEAIAITLSDTGDTTIISAGDEQLAFLSGALALDATHFLV
ncbi:MAG: DUF4347 domain-containing protein [Cyanobacteriota bacterium]|nr:DUF4347 domain-containing protein [Cyanobacteriota bacterium]